MGSFATAHISLQQELLASTRKIAATAAEATTNLCLLAGAWLDACHLVHPSANIERISGIHGFSSVKKQDYSAKAVLNIDNDFALTRSTKTVVFMIIMPAACAAIFASIRRQITERTRQVIHAMGRKASLGYPLIYHSSGRNVLRVFDGMTGFVRQRFAPASTLIFANLWFCSHKGLVPPFKESH